MCLQTFYLLSTILNKIVNITNSKTFKYTIQYIHICIFTNKFLQADLIKKLLHRSIYNSMYTIDVQLLLYITSYLILNIKYNNVFFQKLQKNMNSIGGFVNYFTGHPRKNFLLNSLYYNNNINQFSNVPAVQNQQFKIF